MTPRVETSMSGMSGWGLFSRVGILVKSSSVKIRAELLIQDVSFGCRVTVEETTLLQGGYAYGITPLALDKTTHLSGRPCP